MSDTEDVIEVFLQPGDWFAGDRSYRVRTLLGSCVSVVLWNAYLQVGAMCHFLLATRPREMDGPLDGRYGDEALMLMMGELAMNFGIAPADCVAKVFGGGNMFPERANTAALDVGRRNGERAQALLRDYGIPVVSESLFGEGHRQIIFEIASGDVWVRQARPVPVNLLQRQVMA
jgi:chemotaxis protein CheD